MICVQIEDHFCAGLGMGSTISAISLRHFCGDALGVLRNQMMYVAMANVESRSVKAAAKRKGIRDC